MFIIFESIERNSLLIIVAVIQTGVCKRGKPVLHNESHLPLMGGGISRICGSRPKARVAVVGLDASGKSATVSAFVNNDRKVRVANMGVSTEHQRADHAVN